MTWGRPRLPAASLTGAWRIVACCVCFAVGTAAWAADSARLRVAWHVQRGGPATEFAASVAVDNGVVFTVGGSKGDFSCFGSPYYVKSLNCDFTVWTNSLATGSAGWTYRTPGRAEAVATGNGKLFVVGAGAESSGTNDFRIVALDEATGNVAWSDGSLPSGTLGGEAFNVVVAGNMVFAVGSVYTGTGIRQSAYFIRAYDIDTGAILWQNQGTTKDYQGVFFGIGIGGGKVVASGGGGWNWVVRAYDMSTGSVDWTQDVDSGFGFDEAKEVLIRGSRVFAIGELAQQNTEEGRDAYTQAYDLKTGKLLWSRLVDSGGFDALFAIAPSARGLYEGGTSGAGCQFFEPGDCPLYTASLDPASGDILWQDSLDTTGVGEVTSLGTWGKYVYMTGQGGTDCPDTCQLVLRAYRARTGRIVSTKFIDLHGGDNTNSTLTIADGYLLLVGSTQTRQGDYDAFMTAYRLPADLDGGR